MARTAKNSMGLNGRQRPASERDDRAKRVLKRLNSTPKRSRAPQKSASSGLFSGDVLYSAKVRRHYPFVLYVCLVVLLYMSFRFAGHSIQREEINCRIELQHLRSKALLISTQRLEAVSHDNLIEEIEKRGLNLKQHNTPPTVIGK